MNTSLLLWLALLGITGLALVLYMPRRFSGPMTEHERRMAHRGRHRRSFLLVLVTPVATIVGLLLLVPPLIALDVHSHVWWERTLNDSKSRERSLLWPLAFDESTYDWTAAVLCRVNPADAGDEAALADAIVVAAGDGFNLDEECRIRIAELQEHFDARDFRNVELSLVALAERAYVLTDVVIHAGPRLQDPDPWDVMAGTLEQSAGVFDLQPMVHVLGHDAPERPDRILRLSRARPRPDQRTLEVLALVRGTPCRSGPCTAILVHPNGDRVGECSLTPIHDALQHQEIRQRMVTMLVGCDRPLGDLDGHMLVADEGETSIVTAALPISGDARLRSAIAAAHTSNVFAEEMRGHNLRPLRIEDRTALQVHFGGRITVAGGTPLSPSCAPALNRGPFSWSGMTRPKITVNGDAIDIKIDPDVLDPTTPAYDPSTFYATLYTITWAANSLHEGRCLERAEPRPSPSHLPAHPVLTAEQLDEAAAGLRRGRETIGLVLIAIAVLSLALGLRRSVL